MLLGHHSTDSKDCACWFHYQTFHSLWNVSLSCLHKPKSEITHWQENKSEATYSCQAQWQLHLSLSPQMFRQLPVLIPHYQNNCLTNNSLTLSLRLTLLSQGVRHKQEGFLHEPVIEISCATENETVPSIENVISSERRVDKTGTWIENAHVLRYTKSYKLQQYLLDNQTVTESMQNYLACQRLHTTNFPPLVSSTYLHTFFVISSTACQHYPTCAAPRLDHVTNKLFLYL